MMSDKKRKNLSPPPSNTDPLGMYTGKPEDRDDVPEQDADDL